MDADSRDWEDEGSEDFEFFTRTYSPLAELATELALCYEALAQHSGSPCTTCTCQLGYHLSCDDGSCENCGCEEIYWYCAECGESRPISAYLAGSKICTFCVNTPPVKIVPLRDHRREPSEISPFSFAKLENLREWNRDVREALKELTE